MINRLGTFGYWGVDSKGTLTSPTGKYKFWLPFKLAVLFHTWVNRYEQVN